MKGVILKCLEELVKEKFGPVKWKNSLLNAGIEQNTTFLTTSNINDKDFTNILSCVCKETNLSLSDIADEFGDYWVNVFAPRIYGIYYKGHKTAKEFLVNMDSVHEQTTTNMPDAHPPRFDYEWKDKKTMIMTYKSKRGLIYLMVGLIKGVGSYYSEDLKITKLNDEQIQIVFPK